MNSLKEFPQKKESEPRRVVVMFIHNQQGEILFTRRSLNRKFLPGIWALPAGHIENQESFQDTVRREANEELGIDVEDVNLVEIIEEPGGEKTKVFLVDIPHDSYSGTPQMANEEFKEIQWFSTTEFYNKFSDNEIGTTLRHLRPRFQNK